MRVNGFGASLHSVCSTAAHLWSCSTQEHIYLFLDVKRMYPVAPVDDLVVTIRLVLAPGCGM